MNIETVESHQETFVTHHDQDTQDQEKSLDGNDEKKPFNLIR